MKREIIVNSSLVETRVAVIEDGTLVELLIVISVIAILASLTFPAASAAKMAIMRARARAELAQVELAIQGYNQKLGYYPPDNGTNYSLNQLYYELLGTTNYNGVYQALDGSAQISAATLTNIFGPNVTGFQNCARGGGGDEVPSAVSFLKGLKSSQFLPITNGVSATPCSVLGSGIDGPQVLQNTNLVKINPWRYNSSSPRYNPKSFDLWIDVMAGAKTNRICNWSDRPLVVSAPYL